jgi:type II secretory pathway component PulF
MSEAVQRIDAEDFLRFNEHLLGLVRARVPLGEGLRQMADEVEGGRLQSFVAAVAQDIERGQQLSAALAKFSPQIPDYYLAIVAAGEQSGSLADVLHHIVTETRRQIDYRRALFTSLAYPAMVVLFAAVVLAFVSVVIIPKFKEIYAQLGAELPAPTAVMIVIVDFLLSRKVPLLVGLLLVALVLRQSFAGRIARRLRDALLLNIPLVGRIVFNDFAITFTRCTGFLLSRGVAMVDALTLTESVVQNLVARDFVAVLRQGVSGGESLSRMLEAYPYFPASTRWIIRLSEERGDLPQTLLDLADFYDVKQQHIREAFRGMLEPILIVALGCVIGTIIVLLYLPLFEIPKVIS